MKNVEVKSATKYLLIGNWWWIRNDDWTRNDGFIRNYGCPRNDGWTKKYGCTKVSDEQEIEYQNSITETEVNDEYVTLYEDISDIEDTLITTSQNTEMVAILQERMD